MQKAVEDLFADADAALASLNTALTSIAELTGNATDLAGLLAAKQPKTTTLTAISLLAPDPGALEQVQAGQFAIRPIDAADTKSLVTRELGDSRWLGQNHGAATAAKWTTARSITMTSDVSWTVTIDGSSNVTAAGTIQSHVVTFPKLVAATQKALIGANAAGNFQEITLGSGLALAAGVLSASGSGGTVTNFAFTNGGGISGTVTNATTTPALALTLDANGVALSKLTAAGAASILGATAAGNAAYLTPAQAKTVLAIAAADVSGLATIATSGSATDLSAGTVPAGRMPAHTGDVTSSAGAVALTIANDAVTYAKMQNVSATNRFLGRITAGAGDPEELTAAQAKTILGIVASDIGSGAALTKTDDTNVTLTLGGTPGSALLAATSLTLGWTGILAAARGGTANGFTAFSGPATSTKTFTLPNASDTIGCLGQAQTWSGVQTFSAIPVLSGGAIAFPATQIAAADPNTLDDYEEGTFTPALKFGGGATGMTYSSQLGKYTKIGRLVFIEVKIILSAKGSSVGAATISGLPFVTGAAPNSSGAFMAGNLTTVAVPFFLFGASSASISLFDFSGSTWTSLFDTDFTNTSEIYFGTAYAV